MNLTIIIPTYGRAERITDTIESIVNASTNINIEVVVVDDNGLGSISQLETENILKYYIDNKEIKYLVLEKNMGACDARNFGVAHASSELVTFLDDDDKVILNSLIKKLEYFLINYDHDICCSDMLIKFDDSSKQRYSEFNGINPEKFLLEGMCLTSMIMIKKESFLKMGGFISCPKYQDHVLMLNSYINDLSIIHFKCATFVHDQTDVGYRISNTFNSGNYQVRMNYENLLADKINLNSEKRLKLKLRQGLFLTKEMPPVSIYTYCEILRLVKNIRSITDIFNVLKRFLSKCVSTRLLIYCRRFM